MKIKRSQLAKLISEVILKSRLIKEELTDEEARISAALEADADWFNTLDRDSRETEGKIYSDADARLEELEHLIKDLIFLKKTKELKAVLKNYLGQIGGF